MDNLWIYVGAGFVGFLWGMGSIAGTVAVAFMVGLWLGNSDAALWAVLALIAGYIIGNIMSRKRQA